MNQKEKILLLTVGMIILSLIPFFIGKLFYPDQMNYGPNTSDNLPRTISTFISLLFIIFGAINILRYKEIPRLGLESIEGLTAIIIGILLLIISCYAEVVIIIEIFHQLFNG